jgi:hypothetical protein
MELITVDEFVPELHSNAKFRSTNPEEAADWWTAQMLGRTIGGAELDRITLAIISTMVFFGIIVDE